MKKRSLISEMVVILCFALLTAPIFGQTTIFKRTAVIPPRAADPEGYGNLVSGDVTGSGAPQIYAVSGELNTNPIVPRIYEFKWDGTKWDSVWAAVPGLTDQNTWCPLAIADLDGDGRKEIVWGPVNASPYTADQIRLIDYEADGTGGDALGVPDGSGGYAPNATWSMEDTVAINSRPFRWVTANLYNNGKQELVFVTRTGPYIFGVISVDNIPDNGGGGETWKMDTSGVDTAMAIGQSYKDVAVIDSTIYLINLSGDMQPVYYANGKFTIGKLYSNVVPGGDWKSAQVVDLAGDGHKEIVVGSWNNKKIYLLQPLGDSLSTTEIADFTPLGANLIDGSTVGDFNGDGHLDFAFGSRYATPNASIYVLYYNGGDITSMSSYSTAIADSGLAVGDKQWEMLTTDSVSSPQQIVYSGLPRTGGPVPIGVLSSMKVDSLSTIANARVDANHDFVPDSLGKTFKVIGVVNSVNWGTSSNYFSYTIQDGSAGIDLYKSGGVGDTLHVGDRVLAKGTVTQYNGLTELSLGNFTTDLTILDTGRTLTPKVITLAELNKNGESYESMLATIKGVAPAPSNTVSWPAANSNAGIKIWDGYNMGTMYIDKDAELDGTTEPTYPVDVTGVVNQYSAATPPDNGYEIQPMFSSDFVQGVAVPPTPYFFFDSTFKAMAMKDGLTITDSTEVDTVRWTPSVDLNGDALTYAFQIYAPGGSAPLLTVESNNNGADTVALVKATDVLKDVLKGADTVAVDLIVNVLANKDLVTSVDTIHTMIINDIVTGIKDKTVPHTFYVDQNYPNPFNPTTTIRFGLQKQIAVNLIVYNILGQQVAVLLNHQVMGAGMHEVQFNASRLASGTYIYRLQAGNNVVNKKMVLLK